MRWWLAVLLIGCQGETVAASLSDAGDAGGVTSDSVLADGVTTDGVFVDAIGIDTTVGDTSAVPDTELSDAWPTAALTTSPGCGTFPGPMMVRLNASSPFCIDTTEVTNAQYDFFLASSKPAAPAYCFTPVYGSSETAVTGPNKPRANVPWCAAFQYCAWAGKRLCGKIGGGHSSYTTYFSNTESQWSYACRQGSANTNFPYGATEDKTKCVVAGPVADVGSKKGCTGQTTPYNQIVDLSGNAGEWSDACDRYDGASGEDVRVCALRGGWTGNTRQDCNEPQVSTVMYRAEDLTFRCCRDL